MSNKTECVKCGRMVQWVINPSTGQRARVDLEPMPTVGDLLLNGDGTYREADDYDKKIAATVRTPLYRFHWQVCPDAQQWRAAMETRPAMPETVPWRRQGA